MYEDHVKALTKGILGWPQNQVCITCVHREVLCLEDLQKKGLFEEVNPDDPTSWSFEDEPLLMHASTCAVGKTPDRRGNCPFVEECQ
jgi:hypothetical protein